MSYFTAEDKAINEERVGVRSAADIVYYHVSQWERSRLRAAAKANCRIVDIVSCEAQREDEMLKYPSARHALFREVEEFGIA